MSWHIDHNGIHISAFTLCEAEADLKAVRERLTTTPRTVAEENAQAMRTWMDVMGGLRDGTFLAEPREVDRVHN